MDCIVYGVTKSWTQLSDFTSLDGSCLPHNTKWKLFPQMNNIEVGKGLD